MIISISLRLPCDFSRSTSNKKVPENSLSNSLFSANFQAISLSSFLDEYLLGKPPSMKLKSKPQPVWPTVGSMGQKRT